jgi:hypothetical protein
VAIPKKIPTAGVAIALPKPPLTLGPFKATATKITISEDRHLTFTVVVSGSSLTFTCLAYPNNSMPTGVTFSKPQGSPISPVIASS